MPFSSATVRGSDGPAVDPDGSRTRTAAIRGAGRTPPEPWPEQQLEDAETRDAALAAIDALPPRQRAVISLRDMEGFSSEEVCNALDISETNQRVLLHRARSKVRGALEAHLGGRMMTCQELVELVTDYLEGGWRRATWSASRRTSSCASPA